MLHTCLLFLHRLVILISFKFPLRKKFINADRKYVSVKKSKDLALTIQRAYCGLCMPTKIDFSK